MLSRIAAARRLPVIARTYATSSRDGSVAQSRGFKEKESAQEGEYAKRQEAEQLLKLRAQIEKKKTELEQLEKEHKAELEKAGKA